MLDPGFHDVPPGMVAAIVTHLEMRERPEPRPVPDHPDMGLVLKPVPDPAWYRALFRRIGGTDWLWFSRLSMPDDDLAQVLANPDVLVFVLTIDGREQGLLELDFRDEGACELAFLGVARELIGSGAGRMMMNAAITMAWERPIARFHVHTCTFDHPAALAFYERSGFVVTRCQIEIAPDPRLCGVLPADAAPHVPVIVR